jgi:hypothetical protein
MAIEIFDTPQNSDEWLRARLGIPTASAFATIMAKGKGGGESLTRKKYLYQLAGERITGEPAESFSNTHMQRGHAMEDEARKFYSFMTDEEPRLVGFIKNGQIGCSPDSLLGDAGVLEIKTKQPNVLIEAILRDDFPPEHKAQCQGILLVAEREWCDLFAYWPKMPPFIWRAERDNGYIANLAGEVARFNDELDALVETITKIGNAA